MKGILHLVATPIGNLSDMSERALKTLEMADFVAAEDTRHTLKLLNYFNIKKPMISYFEHNKLQRGEIIIDRILNGENCALVTDAGTPAISDPGEDLVRQCHDAGIDVVPIPGPCAFVQALIVSGLPTGRFSFEGFLSVTKNSRKEHLESIKTLPHTLIFYEAPHKLLATLKDLLVFLGNRKIAVVREITKLHEQILRFDIETAISHFEENAPKGEFCLVVEGYTKKDDENNIISEEMILNKAKEFIDAGLSKKDASKETAQFFNIPKNSVYKLLHS